MTAAVKPQIRARERTTTERMVRFLNKTPIHIALALIALIWLAPTVGLLVTSFRPRQDIAVSGWWEALGQFRFTLANYGEVIGAQGLGQSFLNTFFIAVPSTLIPLTLASMAAYAFSWMEFRGRYFLFVLVVGLLVVPAGWAV